MNSTTKQPQVVVKPFMRLDPDAIAAINKIKDTIAEYGFFSVEEFKELIEETGFAPMDLLFALQTEGILHVNTTGINKDLAQEVLVDVRPMAAAMLLIYSDKTFAKTNSVYKYLEMLFKIGEWKSAFPPIILHPLLRDTYEAYGHHFTDMVVAETADLSSENESIILSRAQRFVNPMRELMKSDTELTAVYELTIRTMDVLNGTMVNGAKAVRSSVQHRVFQKPKAYGVFWTAAQKVLDNHAKRVKKESK